MLDPGFRLGKLLFAKFYCSKQITKIKLCLYSQTSIPHHSYLTLRGADTFLPRAVAGAMASLQSSKLAMNSSSACTSVTRHRHLGYGGPCKRLQPCRRQSGCPPQTH